MVTNRIQELLKTKDNLAKVPLLELFNGIFLSNDSSDREFLASLVNFHLSTRQKKILMADDPTPIKQANVDGDRKRRREINLIIGVDGVGKSIFRATALDLFSHTYFVQKNHHSLYKFCQTCFDLKFPLTIEARLTTDDFDLVPICKLAKEKDYLVSIYAIEVESGEIIHDRLSSRKGRSPFTGAELQAKQFYCQDLLDDLLDQADRFAIFDNSTYFNLIQLSGNYQLN
mgnify:FL=1